MKLTDDIVIALAARDYGPELREAQQDFSAKQLTKCSASGKCLCGAKHSLVHTTNCPSFKQAVGLQIIEHFRQILSGQDLSKTRAQRAAIELVNAQVAEYSSLDVSDMQLDLQQLNR